MYNVLRFLFILFFYFSNVSTILSIYPISYYLIQNTSIEPQWYHFGLLFSIYELGKFSSIWIWEYIHKRYSSLILILMSLFLLALCNISFSLVVQFYQIIIFRFIFGFSNIIGTFFKDIYNKIGFRKNNTIIILSISMICTTISLFFPSIIIYFNVGEKLLNFQIIKFKNTMFIYLCLAISNLLPIIFGYILILKNKLKVEQAFIPMPNVEKTENSVEKSLGTQKNNFIETEQKSHSKVIKVNNPIYDSKIQISLQKNINNENEAVANKDRKNSDNKNFNNIERKEDDVPNVEQINNINNSFNLKDISIENKEYQLCFIQTSLNMVDGLSLIWILIILYNHFKQSCLQISIYFSILKILGEIILFPINERIMRKSSAVIPLDFESISHRMKIITIISLILSICISQNILFIYFYENFQDLLLIALLIFLLIKTIFSGIFTQYYKIYNNLFFKQNNIKNKNLKKYNQFYGSIGKSIIYFVGSFGLYIIELLYHKNDKTKIVMYSLYFHAIPQIIYLILFFACSKYIN